mmetsp:Transcript_67449/g.158209  ORF Transcript_67449/g.158209 Transcript_67449/m.158209 type:complete len:409 (+) Transcript_67449:635-1861(+)
MRMAGPILNLTMVNMCVMASRSVALEPAVRRPFTRSSKNLLMASIWSWSFSQNIYCSSMRSDSDTVVAPAVQAARRMSRAAFASLRSEITQSFSAMKSRRSIIISCKSSGKATSPASLWASSICSSVRIASSLSVSRSKGSLGTVGRASKSWRKAAAAPRVIGETMCLRRKRSCKAASSSPSNSSLEAATTHFSGTSIRVSPLSKTRSFNKVSRQFKIAEFALNTSSRKATSAWGRKPSTLRFSLSFSKAFKDNGPKTSSGTEKRVKRRSKYSPPQTRAMRRARRLFAVPGGPRKRTFSLPRKASKRSLASTARSCKPSVRQCCAFCMRSCRSRSSSSRPEDVSSSCSASDLSSEIFPCTLSSISLTRDVASCRLTSNSQTLADSSFQSLNVRWLICFPADASTRFTG